jgi:hypothetical protein
MVWALRVAAVWALRLCSSRATSGSASSFTTLSASATLAGAGGGLAFGFSPTGRAGNPATICLQAKVNNALLSSSSP